MEPVTDTAARILAELRHPVRLPLLLALEAKPRSPSELAADLDQPFDAVNYAVRALAAAGLVELVGREQTGGSPNLLRKVYASKYRGWQSLIDALEAVAASADAG